MIKTIFCIMGKSSCGKDTCVRLMEKYPEAKVLVPYTSRPMRDNEIDGKTYNFISKEEFIKLQKEGFFIESRSYDVKTNGIIDTWYYGTPNPIYDTNILICTPDTLTTIRKNRHDLLLIPIYIYIPEEERLTRMIIRETKNTNPNYKELSRRFLNDTTDFSDNTIRKLVDPFAIITGIQNKFENYDSEKVAEDIHTAISVFKLKYSNNELKEDLRDVMSM